MKRALVAGSLLLLLAAAWMQRREILRLVPTPMLPIPAHGQYAAALALTGLATSGAGQAWLRAADEALVAPGEASLQHNRHAVFTGAPGEVLSWRFAARRGQRITIALDARSATVFVDLFDAGRDRVASAPAGSAQLTHVVERDGDHIARVQPALDATGALRVAQQAEASLVFPIQGVSGRAMQSGFGLARDAGIRRHEGIDIFAPRGTPVVAAADGWVTQQTSNRMGGNVVWIWSPGAGASLYYAHLDRRNVNPGARVRAGDVIGYVGNTGNARNTAPHLHFGIYTRTDGVVDPAPYVIDPPDAPSRRS